MIDKLTRIWRKRLEIAHANGQLARRPRIGEPNGPDCHGAFGAPHSRLRHNADADVAFDQTTDGIETSQLHPQAKRTPDAIGLVCEEPLDRTGAVEADHVVVQYFGKAYARPAGEFMILGDDQNKTVVAKREGLQTSIIDGARYNSDVGIALSY